MADTPVPWQPVLRSPVTVAPHAGPVTVTDASITTAVVLHASPAGVAAAELGTGFGRAVHQDDGTFVIGSGPGEWLLLAPPGERDRLLRRAAAIAAVAGPDELVTAVDISHGRAMLRVTGAAAAELLALLCGIDASDAAMPDGAALRTAVAGVATDIVRDDAGGVRSYLLHVERSSGQYLCDQLTNAASVLAARLRAVSQRET